ncbi:TonB-dependent receptor [Erythrobacter sp. EC-HK427]|uniref:TonB-dependent receptor n=1 Tax=Erythrobacter sp. EC-HK427 TaxID=2038396 RepID=UPI00125919A1|nr:TonB-dependent receptor [Erythrobacter sp. EC-HK427]VVT17610.1 TonB-dependent receptor [Erythrobacter sp. EC-HK427]
MTKSFSRLLATSALIGATATANPAFAQDEGAQEETGVGTIIVTAQRRSEDIQDVPVSVTAVDSDTLAAVNASGADIRALSGRAPSLIVESSFGRTFPRFYIRGLGNTDFDFNASQPVSLVYDDVVLENPILKGFPVFDMQQVEVLRGPQGTLFGRNTPAGIVKFDTVEPSSNLEGYAQVSYGSFNNVNAEAAFNVPVGDVGALRLSGLVQRQDNWVDNVLPSGTTEDAFGGYTDIAFRAQLLLEPTDNFEILLTGQIRDLDGTARLFRANNFTRGQEGLNANFDRDTVSVDGQNAQSVTTQNLAARVTLDLGAVSVISVTSFWHGESSSVGDVDGGFGANFLPPNLTGPGQIPFTAETRDLIPGLDQFTQELRIASNGDGPLSYQGGIFFFSEDLSIRSDNFSTLGDPLNQPGGVNIVVSQFQQSDAFGLFGSFTYDLTEQLSISAGARYNDDSREFEVVRSADSQFPVFLQNPLGTVTREVSDDTITWDASITYAATDDVNLYARVARGYRAPSIQGRILFPPATATPLEDGVTVAGSETITSYETGIKSTFWDSRARVNLTGYIYDLNDAQLTAVGGNVNANRLVNADNVRGYGLELDAQLAPVDGLTFTAGLSYNHTEIQDAGLTTAACGGVRVDTFPDVSLCTITDPIVTPAAPFAAAIVSIDGNSLPQAPEWIANWTARYEFPVGDGDVYLLTDWYYRSRINFFLYESVEFQDASLLEGGARLGWDNGTFEVAAFVRNITDDESAVSGIDFNNLTAMVNEPRTYGVFAAVRF